ncbi:MAG: response regulator transcription factor [Parvularculaceae bacterium]
MEEAIRTILIEDVASARQAFTDVIEAHPRLSLVGCAASYKEARKALETPHDLVITDLDLGDGSGLDFIRQTAKVEDRKVIVISVLGDVSSVMTSVQAGADGYVLKSANESELAEAITTVLEGGSPISPAVAGHLLRRIRAASPNTPDKTTTLTAREIEILQLIARGNTNKEVAQRLKISPYTVAEHVKGIYRKMEVKSRGEAVSIAHRDGLLK